MIITYHYDDFVDYEFNVSKEQFRAYLNSLSRSDLVLVAQIAYEELPDNIQEKIWIRNPNIVDEDSFDTMGDEELVDFILQCDIQIFEEFAYDYFYDAAQSEYLNNLTDKLHTKTTISK